MRKHETETWFLKENAYIMKHQVYISGNHGSNGVYSISKTAENATETSSLCEFLVNLQALIAGGSVASRKASVQVPVPHHSRKQNLTFTEILATKSNFYSKTYIYLQCNPDKRKETFLEGLTS